MVDVPQYDWQQLCFSCRYTCQGEQIQKKYTKYILRKFLDEMMQQNLCW